MSSSILQLKRGATADVAAYTGAPGELVVDSTLWTLSLQDGVTVGGHPIGGGGGGGSSSYIDYVDSTTTTDVTIPGGQQGTGAGVADTITAGDVIINGYTVLDSQDLSGGTGNKGRTATSAYSKAVAINSISNGTFGAVCNTCVTFDWLDVPTATETGYTFRINTQYVYNNFDVVAFGSDLTGDDFVAAFVALGVYGVEASFDSGTMRMTFTAADGRNLACQQTNNVTAGKGLGHASGTNNTQNSSRTLLTGSPGVIQSSTLCGTVQLIGDLQLDLTGANNSYFGYTNSTSLTTSIDHTPTVSSVGLQTASTIIKASSGPVTGSGNLVVDLNPISIGTILTGDLNSVPTITAGIAKTIITTTGTNTISDSISPEIFAVFVGAQATQTITFPTPFDGQVLTINAADTLTTLTMTPASGSIKNPLTTMVAGKSVRFIWNAGTTTWY